ncbi:transposase domain-containing protein [Streptomyces sp. NPDC002586]
MAVTLAWKYTAASAESACTGGVGLGRVRDLDAPGRRGCLHRCGRGDCRGVREPGGDRLLVDRVVAEVGCAEKRRRVLSARFTVYFVLALCLFPQAD